MQSLLDRGRDRSASSGITVAASPQNKIYLLTEAEPSNRLSRVCVPHGLSLDGDMGGAGLVKYGCKGDSRDTARFV